MYNNRQMSKKKLRRRRWLFYYTLFSEIIYATWDLYHGKSLYILLNWHWPNLMTILRVSCLGSNRTNFFQYQIHRRRDRRLVIVEKFNYLYDPYSNILLLFNFYGFFHKTALSSVCEKLCFQTPNSHLFDDVRIVTNISPVARPWFLKTIIFKIMDETISIFPII